MKPSCAPLTRFHNEVRKWRCGRPQISRPLDSVGATGRDGPAWCCQRIRQCRRRTQESSPDFATPATLRPEVKWLEANSNWKIQVAHGADRPSPVSAPPYPARPASDLGRRQGLARSQAPPLPSARLRPRLLPRPLPAPPVPSARLRLRPRPRLHQSCPSASGPAQPSGCASRLRPRPGAGRLRERYRSRCLSRCGAADPPQPSLSRAGARPRRLPPQPGPRSPRLQPASAPRGRPRPRHGEGYVQLCSGPEGGQEGRPQERRGGAHHPPRRRRRGLQGPRAGAVGEGRSGRPGQLRGAGRLCAPTAPERAELSLPSGCSPFLSGLSCCFVRKCVCRKRCQRGIGGLGSPERAGLKNCAEFTVPGAFEGMCRGPRLGSFALGTCGNMQNNENRHRLWHFLPSINNVPKMADIITSLNLCASYFRFWAEQRLD